jgi:Putative transposase
MPRRAGTPRRSNADRQRLSRERVGLRHVGDGLSVAYVGRRHARRRVERVFGNRAALADAHAFAAHLAPLRRCEWVVYSTRPFGGPEAVLAYLSRYTHRIAIANSRLIACDRDGVTFKWKDYHAEGRRRKVMTLATNEFIRRFLIHVLPPGFHRIRHYGLFASGARVHTIVRARELLATPQRRDDTADSDNTGANTEAKPVSRPCPCCGGRMIIIETFARSSSRPSRAAARRATVRQPPWSRSESTPHEVARAIVTPEDRFRSSPFLDRQRRRAPTRGRNSF